MVNRAESLESRLFRRGWDDGLLDLFAGLSAVAIGALWAVDLVVFGAIIPMLLALLWEPLRRRIVETRAGVVEFSDTRSERNRRLLGHSAVLGVAFLGFFVVLYFRAADWSAWLSVLISGLPAFLLGLLAVLAGLGLGLPRFLSYGGIFCLCGVAVAFTDARPEVAMIAGGLLVLLNAARLLVRFLRIGIEDGGVN